MDQINWARQNINRTFTLTKKYKVMKIKNYKEWDYTLILIGLVLLIAVLSSCSSSGYGCTGRSKSITGYKQSKYGGYSGRHQGLTRRERRGY